MFCQTMGLENSDSYMSNQVSLKDFRKWLIKSCTKDLEMQKKNITLKIKKIMKISEMVMNQKQFLYVLAKLIEGTEAYLSCRNLLLSGIKLIGNDDLMHGLDDLRKALEMLLKKKVA